MEPSWDVLGQWVYATALFIAICSFTYLTFVPYP